MMRMKLFDQVWKIINVSNPVEKCILTSDLYGHWQNGELIIDHDTPVAVFASAGRPEKPELVHPRKLPKRSLHTLKGRLRFMHAIAHIEFNAINLACDAVYRFRGMPVDYYRDWLAVAADEARHFQLLTGYLSEYECQYGDYPAHNGLWDVAAKSAEDVMLRMALVPRALEARGLDVTPAMVRTLNDCGDHKAADILDTIYREEIAHVAIGSHWFKYICRQRKLDADTVFIQIIKEHFTEGLRGPFNLPARKQAGFNAQELRYLSNK